MERTKPARSSVSNKAASKTCTVCVRKSTGRTLFELLSASRQGKGLVSHFPPKNKNYLWCANEIMELKESSIFALWRHSHSYPPPFSSCLTVPSSRPLFLLHQDFRRCFKDLSHSTVMQTETSKRCSTSQRLLLERHCLTSCWTLFCCEADPPERSRYYSPMATWISMNVKWRCEKNTM